MNLILSGLGAQTVADLVMGISGVISAIFFAALLFAGLYGLYGVRRLNKEGYLIPHRFMYPNYCDPDDCTDPVGYLDYIKPRLTIFGTIMLVCAALIFISYFVDALRGVIIMLIMYAVPLANFLWYNGCLKLSAKKYWQSK